MKWFSQSDGYLKIIAFFVAISYFETTYMCFNVIIRKGGNYDYT